MKKTLVLSLGGSLLVPGKVDVKFLHEFRSVLLKHTRRYKFVVVCGGGSTARTYIAGLADQKISKKVYLQSLLGISVTRLNARFMTYFFGGDANKGIPHEMKEVKDMLAKHAVVFCGALRYAADQTSDSTAAKLARFLDCDFVNLTNVDGLYDKNPKQFRSARFIPYIDSKDFLRRALQIEFHPGQHFVLDGTAAKIIHAESIRTFILGSNMHNFNNFLEGRHYVGTVIG